MTNIEQQHDIVKKSLSQFIKKNIPGANLKHVDAIVLEYVISILEEASQDESFDVEGDFDDFSCDSKFENFLFAKKSFPRNDVGLHHRL